MTPEEFLEKMRLCDHRARCYVQGSAYHEKLKSVQPIAGGWSAIFIKHPRVREAELEGWGNELRSAMIAQCKRRLMAGASPGDAEELFPNRPKWWEARRSRAKLYRLAAEQQSARQFGSDVQFERKLRSPKPMDDITDGVLSDLSQRITGEASGG